MFLKAPPRNFPGAIFSQAGRTPWLKSEGFRFPSYRRTAAAFALTLLSLVSALPAQAHNIFRMSPKKRAAYFAKINEESYQNWMRMIDLLHINLPVTLPPPAEDPNRPKGTFRKKGSSNWYDQAGDTYARSAWGTWNNYDEAKANPYPDLPDPLILNDGKPVKNAETWSKERRPQIVRDFNDEIYGRAPEHTPPVHWKVLRTADTTILPYCLKGQYRDR